MNFVHTLFVVNTELNIVYLVGINIKLIPIYIIYKLFEYKKGSHYIFSLLINLLITS